MSSREDLACFVDESTEDDFLEQMNNFSITTDGPVKKYFQIIRDVEFDSDVKQWVTDSILNITERFHKMDMDDISAYFIKGCKALGKTYTIDEILFALGTSKNKKKILGLIQGTNLKKSPVNYSDVIVPVIITHPAESLISEIVRTFTRTKRIFDNGDLIHLINDIIHFTNIMYDCDESLSNYLPKSCACAFVYFYLTNFTKQEGVIKFTITKTEFKNMTFEDGTKMGNTKDFDSVLKIISENYSSFIEEATQEMIYSLIKADYKAENEDDNYEYGDNDEN